MIFYLNFVYNTAVHKTNRQTQFSIVFGQECKQPIDLLLPKALDTKKPTKNSQGGPAYNSKKSQRDARETLGYREEWEKDMYGKNVFGEQLTQEDRIWPFALHRTKLKKNCLFHEKDHATSLRPYNVGTYHVKVNYKISKDAYAKK